MKALIIGASGLVGGNCLKYFKAQGWEVLGTYFSYEIEGLHYYNTLNPEDKQNAEIESFEADIVVHCGALTWVDYCEENSEESFEKTVTSTQNAIELAKRKQAKFVYFGTDYVFDGKQGFYTETAQTNPLNIYGQHKLDAENLVLNSGLAHLILRITNVYGNEARGKNFISRLSENMMKGDIMELNLPKDQYATPVNAADLARAVYQLVTDNQDGVFHMASTDYMSRIQLAERIASYFGHDKVSINPQKTSELNQAAKRPLLGGFSAEKFLNLYPTFAFSNVDDYLTNLKNSKR